MSIRPLVIACGALTRELRAVLGDADVEVRYLPANFHQRPDRIVPELRGLVAEAHAAGRPVTVGYADCGTGGELDRLLDEFPGTRRLPGDHCYAFFTGVEAFTRMHSEELGTFFLTDFLAKHFRAVIWEGLWLDRHPELLSQYFAHYERVVLLSQAEDQKVIEAGQLAADMLGLRFEHRHTGLAPFAEVVAEALPAHVPVAIRSAHAA